MIKEYLVGHVEVYKELTKDPNPFTFKEYNGKIIVRQNDEDFVENGNYDIADWEEYSFGIILHCDEELKIYKEDGFTIFDLT